MAKPRNLKLSQERVSQKFDLKQIFGVDVSRNQDLKDAFSQMLIDKILDRCKAGVDYNGKGFKKYSEEYKNSLNFHAFKKTDKVDMFLSGEMLGTLDVMSSKGNEIEIGFPEDQSPKAFNHMTGDTVPERLFFGITDAEAKEIAADIKPRIAKNEKVEPHAVDSLFDKLEKFFGGSSGERNESSNIGNSRDQGSTSKGD